MPSPTQVHHKQTYNELSLYIKEKVPQHINESTRTPLELKNKISEESNTQRNIDTRHKKLSSILQLHEMSRHQLNQAVNEKRTRLRHS